MGGGAVHGTPRPLYSPEIVYKLYRRLGGPQGRYGQVRKTMTPSGFDPRNIQFITSRYSDYKIPAHICRCIFMIVYVCVYVFLFVYEYAHTMSICLCVKLNNAGNGK